MNTQYAITVRNISKEFRIFQRKDATGLSRIVRAISQKKQPIHRSNVIQALNDKDRPADFGCSRQLVLENGNWELA